MTPASKRILALCRWYPPATGGVENYMEQIYRHVVGFDLVVIAPGGPDALAYDAADVGRPAHVTVQRTPARLSADHKRSLLEFASTAFQVARSRGPFDEIHCAHVLMVPLALVLAGRRRRVVVFAHGSEFTNGRFAQLRTRSFNAADTVIANSGVTLDELVQRGVRREKIRVVTPGVDVSRFQPSAEQRIQAREGLGIGADDIVLVSVGRLHPNARHKGFDTLIGVLGAARRKGFPNTRLLIVGGGPPEERARLEGLVDGSDAQNVHFLGRVPDAELASVYAAADVFAMPSRHEPTATGYTTEGFGLVFLEAAAAGLPVVSTRIGGAVHAVADGETGLLAVDDAEHFEAAALGLIADGDARRALGQAGRDRVVSTFAWPVVGKRFSAALRDRADERIANA